MKSHGVSVISPQSVISQTGRAQQSFNGLQKKIRFMDPGVSDVQSLKVSVHQSSHLISSCSDAHLSWQMRTACPKTVGIRGEKNLFPRSEVLRE
jgi:hypothetical protein